MIAKGQAEGCEVEDELAEQPKASAEGQKTFANEDE